MEEEEEAVSAMGKEEEMSEKWHAYSTALVYNVRYSQTSKYQISWHIYGFDDTLLNHINKNIAAKDVHDIKSCLFGTVCIVQWLDPKGRGRRRDV